MHDAIVLAIRDEQKRRLHQQKRGRTAQIGTDKPSLCQAAVTCVFDHAITARSGHIHVAPAVHDNRLRIEEIRRPPVNKGSQVVAADTIEAENLVSAVAGHQQPRAGEDLARVQHAVCVTIGLFSLEEFTAVWYRVAVAVAVKSRFVGSDVNAAILHPRFAVRVNRGRRVGDQQCAGIYAGR